jgi:hypothetical protein
VLIAILGEARLLRRELEEEVGYGFISAAQYHTAQSSTAQMGARVSALFEGRFLTTRRFYHVCAELAHKKHQFATLGEESGNEATIARLREELGRLQAHARS